MPRHGNDRGLPSSSPLSRIIEWVNQKATPGRFDWIPVLRGPIWPSANTEITTSTYAAITGLTQAVTFRSRMRVAVDFYSSLAVTVGPISGLTVRGTCTPTPIDSGGTSGYLMVNDPGVYQLHFREIFDVPANVEYTFGFEAKLDSVAAGTVVFPDESTYMTIMAFSDPQS